ncbi:MAG: archaeosine synthase subunit alpha [Archaeoglobaceae archaeon]|nr:archaeosine synthase subunit alpha [Archaeoglobaceae archaeon]MDW8118823.1 archaeosine synthase subunit alpha [Archaeoglobaceae archaeon]
MFYTEKRDGFARLGALELNGFSIRTPAMLEGEVLKKFDYGKAPYAVKRILPEIYESLRPQGEIEILTGLTSMSPREIAEAFSELRGLKPIFAVACADPQNLAMLIYLGVDLVDNIMAVAKAYNGIYFLGDFEIKIEKLKTFPCNCKFCKSQKLNGLRKDEILEITAMHNTEQLRIELEKCKILIEEERLRNYVEAKAKLNPEMTALLRFSDLEESICFPRFRRATCYFNSQESLNRFEVKYFLKRSVECYKPKTRALLLLPCTAKKPYLLSKTHRIIRSVVKVNVNEIMISSPLVVPRELELIYPAVNYDTPVTGYWSEEEINFVANWLSKLVERGKFEKIIAHVEGGYRKVVEKALKDYEVIFTADGDILSEESLKRLKKELEGFDKFDLYYEMFSHALRYQFDLEAEGVVKGKYPEIELLKGERIARFDLRYGNLDIYSYLAKELIRKGDYAVKIADFEPTTTIFSAGVEEADQKIRPNDVVVFINSTHYGVGIARMHGKEMVEAKKGVAIEVRRKYRF